MGIIILINDVNVYKVFYNSEILNFESMFVLVIINIINWLVNLYGILWFIYNFSFSFKLILMYVINDCCKIFIDGRDKIFIEFEFVYIGGKIVYFLLGNFVCGINYIVNVLEMYLIKVEVNV